MLAIKGTDANMQCHGGFQYELGKTYKIDKEPILCVHGFHACLNPYEVLDYYGNDGKNRYFLVELGGTITDCNSFDNKVVANEITFLKEVSVDDFPTLFEEFINDNERLAKLDYVDGFVSVVNDDKYNFIDYDGNYLCDEWFDYAGSFSDGFAKVMKNYKYNLINKDSKLVSEEWFDYAGSFSDGFAMVSKDEKYNFIDKEGKLISKDWFDEANSFFDGIATVNNNGKYNFIDKEGKLLCDEWIVVGDYSELFNLRKMYTVQHL